MTDIRAARKVLRRKKSRHIPAFAFPVRESYLNHCAIWAANALQRHCASGKHSSATRIGKQRANAGPQPAMAQPPHPDDTSLPEANDWSDMKTDKAPPAFFFTDMGVKPVIAVFGKKHASAFPKNAPGASVRCSRVEICLKFCRMCLSGPFTTWRSQFPTGAHGPRVLHRTDKKFPQN